jgi:hypothetical protein
MFSMKRFFVFALGFLLSFSVAFAQKNDRSTMRIRLSDGSPLMVTINGRDFKKTGRAITIGDIPKKRQDIQVYRFRPYADGGGGKAELVYSGTVKLEKGNTYDCIVDIGTRKFRMKEVASLAPVPDRLPFRPGNDKPIQEQTPVDEIPGNEPVASTRLQGLKAAMDRVDEDSKKLVEAKKFIGQNTISSAEAKAIASWIFFDDNRMLFVKSAYPKVTDKNNFQQVGTVFTLEDSRKEFDAFMKGK